MDHFKILKELTSYPAVSGFEEKTSLYISELFKKYCESVEIDRFYNVIGFKKGISGGKKILITAHYDEIGFLVKSIDENGFLKLVAMGGVDSKILLAQEVVVHGKKDVFGVIGAKPPHLLKPEETKKAVKLNELYVDTGYKKDKVSELVSIGSPVTLKAEAVLLNENRFSGKSLDNRCSIAALIEILEQLKGIPHESDIYFVATTQEEVEALGATVATYNLKPDFAIVIDTCHGVIPDAPKEGTFELGKGPAIGIGPNLHRKLTNKIIEVAKNENIPYQIDVEPDDSGTEAWVTQVSRAGVPTVLVSIPLKYMHTAIETIHFDDIKNSSKLVAKFITNVTTGMEELLCY
jgi:tetrahedral aminopeptidase